MKQVLLPISDIANGCGKPEDSLHVNYIERGS
jgi:hypothetical protein